MSHLRADIGMKEGSVGGCLGRPLPCHPNLSLSEPDKLRGVSGELGADVGEGRVDLGGDRVHARNGGEGDERDNERVLDQVLALFVAIKIHQEVFHLFGP